MNDNKFNRFAAATCLAAMLVIPFIHIHAQTPSPTPVLTTITTSLGTSYCIHQDFAAVLDARVTKIRATVRAERSKGKFIGYISIPLSKTGGGNADVNKFVAAHLKKYLESWYGGKVWMLDPGAEQAIPDQNGNSAGGPEYMYMWTQVLAGEDGRGRDFDFFYFAGPTDFWRSLKLTKGNSVAELEALADKYKVPKDAKSLFVSYYAFRASATASKGSHDEWNIFRLINNARRSDVAFGIGDQIAGYFDGRAMEVDDTENSVSTGYEEACK